jgi:hypothetical protein
MAFAIRAFAERADHPFDDADHRESGAGKHIPAMLNLNGKRSTPRMRPSNRDPSSPAVALCNVCTREIEFFSQAAHLVAQEFGRSSLFFPSALRNADDVSDVS